MVVGIKNWIAQILSGFDHEDIKLYTVGDKAALVDDIIEKVQGLTLMARSESDGRLPLKIGLKTVRASPLLFLANLARITSDKAQKLRDSDRASSGAFSLITSTTLSMIQREVSVIEQNLVSGIVSSNPANDFHDSADLSLNLYWVLNQITTDPTLFKDSFTNAIGDCMDKANASAVSNFIEKASYSAQHLTAERQIDAFCAQSGPVLTGFIFDYVAGVNPYHLHDILSSTIFDDGKFHSSICENDPNPQYYYRLRNLDPRGASLIAYRHCGFLQTSEQQQVFLREYGRMFLHSISNIEEGWASEDLSVLLVPKARSVTQHCPMQLAVTEAEFVKYVLSHGLACVTAAGISPYDCLQLEEKAITFNSFSGAVEPELLWHVMKAADAAKSINFKPGELKDASTQMNDYTRAQRF